MSRTRKRLVALVHSEHCQNCNDNTCAISVAYRLGYSNWAVHQFSSTGASSSEFDRLYSKLDPKFHSDAEEERKLLCEEDHVDCDCGAIIWHPKECDYHCDSCGGQVLTPSQNSDPSARAQMTGGAK